MTTNNRRILVVEDSPTQAAEIETTLAGAGFEVDLAPDGLAAIERLRGATYHLVLADIIMPGMWGDELCRKIKADPRTVHVPVILLTSLSEPSDVIQGLESGADSYLTKPWVAEDLLRRVTSVLAAAAAGRAFVHPTGSPLVIDFMGKPFTITRDRRQVLEYFAWTFEDYVQAKQREWESRAAEVVEREKRETAAALARVATELMTSLEVGVIASHLCRLAVEILGCGCSHTLLRDTATGEYVLLAGYGTTPLEWQSMREMRLSPEAVSGLVARLQVEKSVRMAVDDSFPETVGGLWSGLAGAGESLCTALWRGGNVIGLQVASHRDNGGTFTPRQEEMARGMAEIASLALDNARLHQDLDRASRLKSDFINTMSHELRTPLQVILGYTQMILDGAGLADDDRDSLKRVHRSASDLANLVNSTLAMGKLERGEVPVHIVDTDLEDLLAGVVERQTERWNKSEVRVLCSIEPGAERLRTDARMLTTIVDNLLDNALKFTECGEVRLCAMLVDRAPPLDATGGGSLQAQVEISVADSGIGIAPEVQAVIFECFRQGDSSMTRQYGGTGLGLYVVQRYARLLGGVVSVASEVGGGSTFRVLLPQREL